MFLVSSDATTPAPQCAPAPGAAAKTLACCAPAGLTGRASSHSPSTATSQFGRIFSRAKYAAARLRIPPHVPANAYKHDVEVARHRSDDGSPTTPCLSI